MSKENSKNYLAEFDEIETLGSSIYKEYIQGNLKENEAIEQLENTFLYAYFQGLRIGCEDLDVDEADIAFFEDIFKQSYNAELVINKYLGGKTWKERLIDHLENLDGEYSIKKLAITEFHRDVNEGIRDLGEVFENVKGQKVYKKWETMQDDKVRDSHSYLQGVKVKLNEDFYTYTGEHAPFPGMFGSPEEDCNCRCRVQLVKE